MSSGVKDVVEVVVVGAVAAGILGGVATPYRISGGSMLPTYTDGDVVLVDKISLMFKPVAGGDVVIVRTPYGVMIKRVVREVEPGEYWVEGDNRDYSTDSREYGAIDQNNVMGRVEMRLWHW